LRMDVDSPREGVTDYIMSVAIIWAAGFVALLVVPVVISWSLDLLTIAASAIDCFGDPPEMQMSALLGHVPDRGPDDAAGDGGRGEASPD
jgi:hypothetical protein